MKLLDKKWKWAVAGILLFLAVVLFYVLYIYVFWTCCPEPVRDESALLRVRESCESQGGFFVEVHGGICQLPTTDAGKVCSDSSECEGFCEANLVPGELSKIASGEQVKKAGACGQWKNFFSGCFYIIEDGAVERFCAD